MNDLPAIQDLSLSIIIFLSALSGAMIGIIVYLFFEERYANRKDSTTFYSEDCGHRSGAAGGDEVLAGWESRSVLPLEAQGKLATDRYTNRD